MDGDREDIDIKESDRPDIATITTSKILKISFQTKAYFYIGGMYCFSLYKQFLTQEQVNTEKTACDAGEDNQAV